MADRCKRVIHLLLALLIVGAPSAKGQTDLTPPLLTLDEAVSIALANNWLVKNSSLEAEKSAFQLSSVRTRRLPEFHVFALESELLKPLDFNFGQGVFGVFPLIGPVPSVDTTIRTPARPNTLVLGTIIQPITQQYKIGLAIRAEELGHEAARERLRAQRQKTANEVRSAYYSLVATQSALAAAREGVKTLQEVKRVAEEYAAVQALLKADSLDIAARLAKQEYQLAVAENSLATQTEHLNQLLGRNLHTVFRVSEMPEIRETDLTLDVARQRALANRPELREMRLKAQQAEYDRRIAKAGYIPDLSFSLGYLGIRSIEMLPGNAAAAGIMLSWEPFDWGRKRNAIAEKTNTLEQAKNGIAETEAQISVEIAMRYRKWREAFLLLKANWITRDAAAEQLRVVTNKFKEQASLVKDVLQAEARNAEASYQYQQALSAYWTDEADLKKAMGEE